MAYNVTSLGATFVQAHLTSVNAVIGIVVLAGGVATVTVPNMTQIQCVFVSPQSANATTVSATTATTFSIAGTGTDNVMWVAFGKMRE